MIDVIVRTDTGDATKLTETAGHLQTRFKFKNCGFTEIHNSVNPGAALTLVDVPIAGLFTLDLDKGVTVSTFRSAGISGYLGLDVDTYLLTCSLLGLLQWRVLALNPLLRPEDFLQHNSEYCLYADRASVQEYIPLLENPTVCRGCREFYHCLGADGELHVLDGVLDHIVATSTVQRQ